MEIILKWPTFATLTTAHHIISDIVSELYYAEQQFEMR